MADKTFGTTGSENARPVEEMVQQVFIFSADYYDKDLFIEKQVHNLSSRGWHIKQIDTVNQGNTLIMSVLAEKKKSKFNFDREFSEVKKNRW
jgi:hypothetical protein